jgi:RNA-directed DNA polymerase
MDAEPPKGEQHHGLEEAGGTRPREPGPRQTFTAFDSPRALTVNLREQVCDPKNIVGAYRRVRSNKGKPGVDGRTVLGLADWLRDNRAALTASLREGTYRPQPVRGVQIPKPGGGQRQLGIPVAVDRLVQQMILQVLRPLLDPTFSNSSYGFRPGRDAHMALEPARVYVAQEGRGFVVDLDLEKFFDRVHHDIRMSRLARRIGDKHLLRIIPRFLQAASFRPVGCRPGCASPVRRERHKVRRSPLG